MTDSRFMQLTRLKTLIAHTIDSIQIDRNSIRVQNSQKFQGIIEISTKEGVNQGLKYMKAQTNNWIKEHPSALYCLDGEILKSDKEKLENLLFLKTDSIKEIRTLDPIQGKNLLGKEGENGVVVINTSLK